VDVLYGACSVWAGWMQRNGPNQAVARCFSPQTPEQHLLVWHDVRYDLDFRGATAFTSECCYGTAIVRKM
jgi:hypothetical protein